MATSGAYDDAFLRGKGGTPVKPDKFETESGAKYEPANAASNNSSSSSSNSSSSNNNSSNSRSSRSRQEQQQQQ